MNVIHILEPRWHDKVVLLADHKIMEHNEVEIGHKSYPNTYYISGVTARSFPLEQMATKAGGKLNVRAVPIAELEKELI